MLSVDSGGNYHGYIGDLARMAILGEPDAELEDLLAEIEGIAARRDEADQGRRHGRRDLRVRRDPGRASRSMHNHVHFLAHGMGLVSHEAPRLTATGPGALRRL